MNRLQFISTHIKQGDGPIYSVPVGTRKQGQSHIYRHPNSKNGLIHPPSNLRNLGEVWDQLVAKFKNHKLIEDMGYIQVDSIAKNVGSWITQNKFDKIYLYCLNRPQWTLIDIGSWMYGYITIPLYDTLGVEAFEHILRLTEGSLIVVTESLTGNLIDNLKKSKSMIKKVLVLDKISYDHEKELKYLGIDVCLFKHIAKNQNIISRPQRNWQSHLTYAFTSGTTGLPKGAITTQKNAITQCLGMKDHYELQPTDIHMSYLPIAHTFQRFVTWTCFYFGANIRYSKHPVAQILKDLAIVKPTTIPIIPRLLNKLYPIMKQIYEKQKNTTKIKGIFGGRLKRIVCGSAPVSAQILTFFKQILECDVRQGYGQTQTTAASFVTYKGDTNFGHVGGPNISVQFKLIDVPQMQYFANANPPKGEVCTRGDSIFVGYYKNEAVTKQTLDNDGWNHSGDIGVILPNGALKIIDRKKNIYKLSQGQYVAPEKVQNIYLRCKYVAECFLFGDSMRQFNIAIVHPAIDLLPSIAKSLGINETDVNKLCLNQKITQFILTEMNKQAKADGLFGFEIAKRIKLSPKSFGTYGIFTSTMKLQRHTAKNVFQQQLKDLYQ